MSKNEKKALWLFLCSFIGHQWIQCQNPTEGSKDYNRGKIQTLNCPSNFISSPQGCIKSCSSPEFLSCPKVFPDYYQPRFCAFTKTGQWRDQTFQCQACLNSNVIGVISQKCSCKFVGCPKCKTCQENQCIDSQKKDCLKCQDYQFNDNGKCVDNCVSMKCSIGSQCIRGKCVLDKCNGKCKSWQTCISSKCQDKCSFMKCANCFRGECGIVDKCSIVKCSGNTQCIDGQCVNKGFCKSKCRQFEFCNSGKCLDLCAKTKCIKGFICKYGKCERINENCKGINCPLGECKNGKCRTTIFKKQKQINIPKLIESTLELFPGAIQKFDKLLIKDEEIKQFDSHFPTSFEGSGIEKLRDTQSEYLGPISKPSQRIFSCENVVCPPGKTCQNGLCLSGSYGK